MLCVTHIQVLQRGYYQGVLALVWALQYVASPLYAEVQQLYDVSNLQ